MNKNDIVTINGRGYDAHTGLPVEKQAAPNDRATKNPVSAAVIHSSVQKSQTLRRRSTKKPVPTSTIPKPVPRSSGRSMDIARSKSISRFAPHPVGKALTTATSPDVADIGPVLHPSVVKAHAKQLAKQATPLVVTPPTAQKIKEEAIATALAKPAPKQKKTSFFRRHTRLINITTGSILLLLIAGFVTYVNLPSLSVRIAAAQAGISATYPDYHPDGYSLNGPVTFSDGKVTMTFAAHTGNRKFTIVQSKSSWDSSALENQISKDSNGQFITTQQQGLTIYTYGGNAAWVNGGILYRIESSSDTVLSGDQIRQIATSM